MRKGGFDIDDKAAINAVRNLIDKIKNPQAAMQNVGATLVDRVRLNFRDSSDAYGNRWESPKCRTGQPLMDRGILRNSIASRATRYEVEIGPSDFKGKAAIHQFGGDIVPKRAKFLRFKCKGKFVYAKRVYIPPRPYMPIRSGRVDLPSSWLAAILDTLRASLEE